MTQRCESCGESFRYPAPVSFERALADAAIEAASRLNLTYVVKANGDVEVWVPNPGLAFELGGVMAELYTGRKPQ